MREHATFPKAFPDMRQIKKISEFVMLVPPKIQSNLQYLCIPLDPKKRNPAGSSSSSSNSKSGTATRRAELLSKERKMPDLANVESRIKSDIAAATAKATRGERVKQQQQQKVQKIMAS